MAKNNAKTLVRTQDLTRVYHLGSQAVPALQGVTMSIGRGQLVALRGRSGSGKTTLLNCIGGLDRPTSGRVWFEERDITDLPERERVRLRRHQIGFVFQAHALLMTYSAYENVDLILRLAGVNRGRRRERTREVLELVGLGNFMDHRPFELSGGQQQRVAIARAIATQQPLILADEPTGELDSATGQHIFQLFRHLADHEGVTVLIATHDLTVGNYTDRVYYLEDGRVHS